MNKTLIISITLLFSLTSYSVFAKEYIMKCDYGSFFMTWKLVNTDITKKIYLRRDGVWIEKCKGKNFEFKHNGDSSVCYYKLKDESKRCAPGYCTPDQIQTLDFLLYTNTIKYPNPKDDLETSSTQCEKLK